MSKIGKIKPEFQPKEALEGEGFNMRMEGGRINFSSFGKVTAKINKSDEETGKH